MAKKSRRELSRHTAVGILMALGASVPAQSADKIYYGGDILTMAGDTPQYVARLAIKDGKIVYAGSASGIARFKGAATQAINLRGRTLLPGFIDAHGHIVDQTMTMDCPQLAPPPVSDVSSFADLIAKMKREVVKNPPKDGKAVLGLGYDDSLLKEKRHPTREILDQISTEYPVVLNHVSGHLYAVNTKALEMLKITRTTPNPPGGIIQKDKNGNPNGILEEQAGALVLPLLSFPDNAKREKALDDVMKMYASFGITTAEDAISNPLNIQILLNKRKQGKVLIDLISYPQWTYFGDFLSGKKKLDVDFYQPGYVESNEGRPNEFSDHVPVKPTLGGTPKEKVGIYVNGVKFGGIKITGDGAPVGKTAYLTQPYLHPPHGEPASYRAYPTLQQPELDAWFDAAYKHNFQIVMHVNGDATADMLILAVKKAQAKYGKKDLRPVSIHTQWVRHDQLLKYKALGIVPSFFTSHCFYWGDFHVKETVGKDRAFAMSAMNFARKNGMIFTNAADAPVVPPDILMNLVWTGVNRVSRSGAVIGPNERVSPYWALKAVTDYAAYQHFEERSKGTLSVGKLADLVILDKNPLKVKPLTIKDIAVVETIKDGVTVFQRGK